MPSLTISRTAEPPEDWGRFASAHGTFYHLPEWARVSARHLPACDWNATRPERTGAARGFLPWQRCPALLGPRRLVSLPFSYAAGPLAADEATADALATAVRERAPKTAAFGG